MSQLPASAIPTPLANISRELVGQKIRVAGRLLAYDVRAGLILVVDGHAGLLVDATNCIDAWSGQSWARQRLGSLMIIGDLQTSKEPQKIPGNEKEQARYSVDTRIALCALHIGNFGGDIDLAEWNKGIADLHQT